MLKSSNINSVLNELADQTPRDQKAQSSNNGNPKQDAETCCSSKDQDVMGSLAALQLSAGVLQIAEPPLVHVRSQLRELIGRQNKIYIDVSKEKYKLDCSEIARLNDMMSDVKRYKDKLTKIKKEMQGIYQRTKELKKRAANVAACKQRDYQRKLERLQQEESLIGGH
ncbi:biogenesis of lysosome-related organelles complex 1 subunit 6 isoform X1 [Drosophila subpulchrella]|uniref:biogenesis of lysosome-related organelles complex 1 subunit 6 isoform X1 n=1 Tax=Drosophila subpulchrella TaxID=1486046 RepID=UPI0018A1A4BE|nr:biogenesis of lysosome-related organelles complex 1 subunit 6 isoform X1 [Drosophila subpulchrella]